MYKNNETWKLPMITKYMRSIKDINSSIESQRISLNEIGLEKYTNSCAYMIYALFYEFPNKKTNSIGIDPL